MRITTDELFARLGIKRTRNYAGHPMRYPATHKQLAMLERLGYEITDDVPKNAAIALIRAIKEGNDGDCTQ